MMAAALTVLTTSAALAALALLLATPEHHSRGEGKGAWPEHATTHVWQGTLWAIGLSGMILILAWVPLASGERWAWWALAFSGAILYGGYLAPVSLREARRLSRADLCFFGGLVILHAAGLALSWLATN